MLTRDQEQFTLSYGEIHNYFKKNDISIINDLYEDYKELSLERDGYYKNDNLSVYTALIEQTLSLIINKFKYFNSFKNPTMVELKEINNSIYKYKNIIYKLIQICILKGISIYKSININFKYFTLSDNMIHELFTKYYKCIYEGEIVLDEDIDKKYLDISADIFFIIYVYSEYTNSKFKNIDTKYIEELINKISY